MRGEFIGIWRRVGASDSHNMQQGRIYALWKFPLNGMTRVTAVHRGENISVSEAEGGYSLQYFEFLAPSWEKWDAILGVPSKGALSLPPHKVPVLLPEVWQKDRRETNPPDYMAAVREFSTPTKKETPP